MMKKKNALWFAPLLAVLFVFGVAVQGAFAATTNTASSQPPILIGNSGSASNISITESGAGALSATSPYNTLTLLCPAGVSFEVTTATNKGVGIAPGSAWDGVYVKVAYGAAPALGSPTAAWVAGSRTLTLSFANTETAADIQTAIDAVLGADYLVVSGPATGGSTAEDPAGVVGGPKVEEVGVGVGVSDVDGYAALSDTDADGLYDKAVWTIDTESTTAADTVTISNVALKLASSVAPGDVALTVTSEAPYNSGLTKGDVVVAKAVEGEAIAQLDGSANNVPIGGAAVALNNVNVIESTAAALSGTDPDNTLVMQLPAGVNFDGTPVVEEDGVGFSTTTATLSDTDADGLNDKAVWTIDTESTTADTVTISNIMVKAAASVAEGDIDATLTSGTALDATLKIASAKPKGITATVVDSTTSAFALVPTADTTLPETPAGRVNVTLDSIMVVENFADDIANGVTTDALTLTLPDGVTFVQDPAIEASNVTESSPDPTGYSTLNLTLGAGGTDRGGLLIGDHPGNAIKVNVDQSVAAGDIVATITGTLGGDDISPIDVVIGKVVETAVDVTANSTIPVIGIGTTGNIGSFTLKESAPQSLLANNAPITVALPSGVTWSAAPTATVSAGNTELTSPATLSTDKGTATFKVTGASTAASTIAIAGSVTVASSASPGDVVATIGGTAGASGSVLVATTQYAVTATSSGIPVLTVGVPTQTIGDLILSEAYAGAMSNGSFRLLTSSGSFVNVDPTVTVAPTGAMTTSDLTFARETTYSTNDTLVVTKAGSGSTSAATITLSGIKLNVPSDAAEGNVTINVLDGDATGSNGAGVKGTSLVMGYIGTPAAMEASPASATLAVDGTTDVAVTNGVGAYSVTTSDDSIATVSVSDGTVTITGVAEGDATITVSDSAEPANTVDIPVTVTAAVTVIQPVPSGQNSNELTGDDIANAPADLGSVATGGDQMQLALNFPAYDAAVDEYVAVQMPDGTLLFVASDDSLTTDIVPYAKGVTDAKTATIVDAFNVCTPFGAAIPTGTWTVYSLAVPANGGDLSAIDWAAGDYDLQFYSFNVSCK